MELIKKYFPDLSESQLASYEALYSLYKDWNSKINVISRKDIDQLYLRHVLHSMSIAKWMEFKPKTKILDVGCGGGFPGIPLAILFPEVSFHLVDSVNKKLTVVKAVAEALDLKNVRTTHTRVEEVKDRYDFVVTRAVAKLDLLMTWSRKNISTRHKNPFPNGLIALKGGDLRAELGIVKKKDYVEQVSIGDYFDEEFFDEKFLIYVQG